MKKIISLIIFIFSAITIYSQGTDCSNAIFVSSNGCSTSGQYNNSGVTGTLTNPSCFTNGNNNGMWFQFIAATPVVNITINGGTLTSPQISILEPPVTGCASGAIFTELSCATSATATVTASYSALTVGNTYYFYVDGANNNVGTFQVCLTSPAQPVNDSPCNPITLPTNNYCSAAQAYTTVGSTSENLFSQFIPNCFSTTEVFNSVFFSFTAVGAAATVTVNGVTLNAPQVAIIGLTNGCTGTDFTSSACSTSSSGTTVTTSVANLIPGQTYLIVVDGSGSNTGTFGICLNSYQPTSTVPNDECSNATYLCPGLNYVATTNGATPNTTIEPHVATNPAGTNGEWNCNGVIDNSIWFTFLTTSPVQPVTFNISSDCSDHGAGYPNGGLYPLGGYLQFEVFKRIDGLSPCAQHSSTNNGSWSSVNCTTIGQGTGTGTLTLTAASLQPNTQYYIVVDNYPGCYCDFNFTVNGNAGASAGADVSMCSSAAPLTLSGVPSSGTWSGPGVTGNSFNPATVGPGVYTIFYTVGACVDDKVITVNGVDVLVSNDISICTGETTQILGSVTPYPSGQTATYSWTANTTLSDVTVLNPTASPTTTTTYTLSANVNGCTDSDQVIVNVSNCGCTITASNSGPYCPGATVNLTATEVVGATYSWNGPSGYSSALQNPTSFSAPTTPGQYSYTVSAQLPNGDNCTSTTQFTVYAPTQINAGNDASICVGASSTLNATGTPTITWTGGYTNGQSVSPLTTSTYTVNGIDANGCTSMDQVTITVNPLPTINAGTDAAVCIGASTSLTATGGTSYTWNASPDLSSTTTATTTATPAATATYTVTGVDVNGCQNTDQVIVAVNQLPTINAGIDVSICNGQSTTLNASGGTTYVWSPSTGLSPTSGTTVTASPSLTTTYTVTGTDTNGCINTDDVIVTVNPNIPVNAGIDTSVCPGGSVTLNAGPVGSFTSITWDNGIQNGVSFNPSSTMTYTVTGTSSNGCVTTDQVIVTVNSLPTINAGADVTICFGQTANLSASGGTSYVWSPSLGLSSTSGANVTSSSSTTTTYTLTGTDVNGCVNTDEVIVNVVTVPDAVFSANVLSGPITLNVDFTNSSSNATSYVWTFGNGSTQNTNDLSSVSSQYGTEGVYTVTLLASNGICSDIATLIITAGPIPPMDIFVPNVFTPNGNDSNEGYWVNVINGKSFEGIIVNRWGNVMFKMDELNEKWDGNFNGKPAAEGVYFIKYSAVGLDDSKQTGHTFFHLIR